MRSASFAGAATGSYIHLIRLKFKRSHASEPRAAVQKDNFIGCQFHPEKSSAAGIEFLDYFLSIN